jgi:uncharacterized protein with HEPN domain
MRSIELYLDDIIAAIDDIASFVREIEGYTGFVNDERTRQAVRVRLIDIGGAASRLPRDLHERYPDIEWRDIAHFGIF